MITKTFKIATTTTSVLMKTCADYVEKGDTSEVTVWLGCSRGDCNYWCHLTCMGFIRCTEKTFESVDWYCPGHKPIYFAEKVKQ
jgi:hypothetical protein